jgi:hypothetical protein
VDGVCSILGRDENAYKILVKKTLRKKSPWNTKAFIGRYIKMDVKEIEG